jgi:hypothetical protein
MYKQRNTYWIRTLDKARKRYGGWLHTDNIYTAKTAAQLCCDIRHGRRIQGFKAGEVWDAEWYRHDDNDDTMCSVMVRIVPPEGAVEQTRFLCGATPLYDVWVTIEQFANI